MPPPPKKPDQRKQESSRCSNSSSSDEEIEMIQPKIKVSKAALVELQQKEAAEVENSD